MGRVVAVLLLSLSLTAFAQTPSSAPKTDASATVPSRVNLDPAAPSVGATTPINVMTQPAAPGDTAVAVPEYRVATPLVPSGPPAEAVSPSPLVMTGEAAATEAASGSVSYAAAPAPVAGPSISVADAAARYKANKANMKSRVIDNNSLVVLDKNPSGLVSANAMTMPQSDLTPEEEASLRHAKPEHAAAGDVLDPRDLAAVEAAVRRSEQQPATAAPPQEMASAQYQQLSREADAAVQQPAAEKQPATYGSTSATSAQDPLPQSDERDRLPESGTGLPLLGLLGFIAAAGGAASIIRARG